MWPKTAKKKPGKTSNSSSESHAPVDVSLDKKADSSVPPVSVSLDKKVDSSVPPVSVSLDKKVDSSVPPVDVSRGKRLNLRSELITQLDKWHDLYEKQCISQEEYQKIRATILKDVLNF